MGFWAKLFGKKNTKLDLASKQETLFVTSVEPTPPPVQIIPQPTTPDVTPSIAEVEAEVEALLRDLFPGNVESPEEEKARKRSEAAKKAAATRAAKKAAGYNSNAVDGDGDGKVQDGTIHERPAPKKKSTPKKK